MGTEKPSGNGTNKIRIALSRSERVAKSIFFVNKTCSWKLNLPFAKLGAWS
jgi:hypothetical protein